MPMCRRMGQLSARLQLSHFGRFLWLRISPKSIKTMIRQFPTIQSMAINVMRFQPRWWQNTLTALLEGARVQTSTPGHLLSPPHRSWVPVKSASQPPLGGQLWGQWHHTTAAMWSNAHVAVGAVLGAGVGAGTLSCELGAGTVVLSWRSECFRCCDSWSGCSSAS